MSLVRRLPLLALVAAMGCASHAKSAASSATMGVKSRLAEVNPAIATQLGDLAGRGAIRGVLAALDTEEQRALVRAFVDTTAAAAARGILTELQPEVARLQGLATSTVNGAIDDLDKRLSEDTVLREQLAAIGHQVSASAVYGARDALAEMFPECSSVSDRRRCVMNAVAEVSRTAARGMMGGIMASVQWPLIALVFLAGMLFMLLLFGARSAVRDTGGRAPEPRHAR